ncbi:MAG: ATP-dependent RecD-like DNA helicase [Clostridia bacterium]|nr:ATP-dependent RecD-like DNA helicase [Clostridia bacterium]
MENKNSLADTVKGTIENVVYRNEENDYTVMEISDSENSLITAVGVIPMAFEGECVVLQGRWTFHKEFGKQFSFDSFEKTLPKEVDGILQYLSSRTVKGVGPVTALKIVNRFGTDTFEVIENHPEWLADVPGITMKKAAVISASFKEQTGIRGVMMFCSEFMSVSEITRVYKSLGAGAVGVIKENPYVLCAGEFGIPFEKADEIARSLGFDPESEFRLLAGIDFVLSYNASVNGHTCLPREKLTLAASEALSLDSAVVSDFIENALDNGELSLYRTDGVDFIMTNETANSEDFIAKKLRLLENTAAKFTRMDIAALIEKVELQSGITYERRQREALFEALDHGVFILTGGPGTGKTTVVKALISIFSGIGMKTALAAPTGRAAKRMSEATSEKARTVHRLLETERGTASSEMRYGRNERNPIDENVIIIDEASMMDLALMTSLLRAVRPGAHLILIGDSDQLPSVGAGNVLSDLIASEAIATVRLTEIFRQAKESLIVTNAHRINAGEAPVLNVTDNDFFFVKRENERDIANTVASLVMERLPRAYGRDIRQKIQVITPSKKGAGGVEILNSVLQSCMNPPAKFKKEKQSHGVVFREGDKVMQIANDYEIEWERGDEVGIGVFNGDIGVIEHIDNQNSALYVRFDDRLAKYGFDILDELDLAYAITVHKSQGSEYPVVIIPMYSCAPMLLSRNLLYTAVTRAKKMVVLVGRSDIPARMVGNNREILRYTTLKSRIFDYC